MPPRLSSDSLRLRLALLKVDLYLSILAALNWWANTVIGPAIIVNLLREGGGGGQK